MLKNKSKLFLDIRQCYKPIPPANAKESSVSRPNSSSVYPLGTNVTFECNTGYVISGQAAITCQGHQTWSAAPTCNQGNGTLLIFYTM